METLWNHFWKVKEKAIQQLLQNHLAAQIPAYTGAFAQPLFFDLSLKMKLKESKVEKTRVRGELRVSRGSFPKYRQG